MFSLLPRQRRWRRWPLLLCSLSFLAGPIHGAADSSVEIVAGYNFVVDSNVTSPSTYAPEVATVMGRFCNTGDVPLTEVWGYIGDAGAGTPGLYPTRDSATAAFQDEHPQLANTGLYSLTHIGSNPDASRYMGSLAVGECKTQYWHMTYPRRGNPDNSGAPVWGASNNPDDDLWLSYDMWMSSNESATSSASFTATMRNEISANANKIFPNGATWFNTNSDTISPGDTVTTNGINYDLGNINKGFDNDGDLEFDYNVWVQPIGDPDFDPNCFRLIRTWGTLTISRSGGNPDMIINFEDQLYFSDLPKDNTGADGEVHYQFLALTGACTLEMTPYQEVASGADNEKFTGDYGAGLPTVGSTEPEVSLDKSVDLSEVSAGGVLDYTIAVTNDGAVPAGLPELGVPVVISDSIPADTTYRAGTAALSFGFSPNSGVKILYSTDNRSSWQAVEPATAADVTDIQWWLQDPLPVSGSATASFEVDVGTPSSLFLENTATAGFGTSSSFAEDTAATMVLGTNVIGDSVWDDADGSKTVNGAETGLGSVLVKLYWDKNGDGELDGGDVLVTTTSTDGSGNYSFGNLPNGDFLVEVDISDADLPFGYTPTTPTLYAVDDLGTTTSSPYNDADFGFKASVSLAKSLTSGDPATEASLVTFDLTLTNDRLVENTEPADCRLTQWGVQFHTATNFDVDPINGLGAPDEMYATTTTSWSGKDMELEGYDFTGQSGGIDKVELIYDFYHTVALSDDQLAATVYNGSFSVNACVWSGPTLDPWVGAGERRSSLL